jgi:hypothetical protein
MDKSGVKELDEVGVEKIMMLTFSGCISLANRAGATAVRIPLDEAWCCEGDDGNLHDLTLSKRFYIKKWKTNKNINKANDEIFG